MVVKKRGKKKVVRKSSKVIRKSTRSSKKKVRSTPQKIKTVIQNLILFAILSLVSYVLYGFSNSESYQNVFTLSTMLFGFIALAFLIALAVLLVLKGIKK